MTRDPKRIPRLHPDAAGRHYWKPEKRLRPHFATVPLGRDPDAARAEARRLNREAQAWLKANPPPARPAGTGPRTVAQLVALYQASEAWRALRPRTQAQYAYELKRLAAEFGHELAGGVDEARVDDWADALKLTAPETLRHVAARGRTLFDWAARRKLGVPRGHNPFRGIGLHGGNKRRFRFLWPDVVHILDTAAAEGVPSIGVALVAAFTTIQRITDVLERGEAEVHTVAGVARLRFHQSKGAKVYKGELRPGFSVDIPMPPALRQALERFPPVVPAGSNSRPWIVSETTGRPYDEKTAARVFARVLAAAIARDPKKWGHLAGGQLRDGRRSGFCHTYLSGVRIELITAISGHSLEEGYAIVEHYFPRDAGMADQAAAGMQVRL